MRSFTSATTSTSTETANTATCARYEPPHEILTLADYRMRHAHYKRDPDLQEMHRQQVFITIWDDHEIANDSYKDGAENHTPDREGTFADRKAAARHAYMEWMPIREQTRGRIFRKLAFGDLVDLVLLDTRLYARTKQAGGVIGAPPLPDPTRTLLGDEQAAWMEDQLKTSTAHWKLLGQQVMVGNLILEKGKQLANLDQWHGYPESRTRLLTFFRDSGVKDIVVLTGDIHSSWANELVIDPNDPTQYDPATGKGSLAVEFVTPGITLAGHPGALPRPHRADARAQPARPVHRAEPSRLRHPRRHARARPGRLVPLRRHRAARADRPKFSAAWSVRAGETRLVAESARPRLVTELRPPRPEGLAGLFRKK